MEQYTLLVMMVHQKPSLIHLQNLWKIVCSENVIWNLTEEMKMKMHSEGKVGKGVIRPLHASDSVPTLQPQEQTVSANADLQRI